jgi:hypothetical protein
VRYREGAKSVRVAVEFLATDGVIVELVSIRAWEPPCEREPLDPERIAARVRDALAYRGLDASIDRT